MSRRQSHEDMQDGAFGHAAGASVADEAAARWVAHLTSGEATPAEFAEFERWRAADPAHERALAGMRGLWTDLGPALAAKGLAGTPAAAGKRRRARRWQPWALAASLVLVTVLAAQAVLNWRYDEVTARGEQRELTLNDGSTLVMSGNTAVDVRLDDQRREIAVARGEVYLEVLPDAARPFVVDAGEAEVHVLGTAFSVRRVPDAVQVVVRTGSVELRSGDATAVLEAGQRMEARNGALSGAQPADTARELAWLQRRLVFEDASLQEIVDALGRHHSGRVVIAGAGLGARRFSTVIDLDRVDDWLAGLERAGSVRVAGLGPVTVIY